MEVYSESRRDEQKQSLNSLTLPTVPRTYSNVRSRSIEWSRCTDTKKQIVFTQHTHCQTKTNNSSTQHTLLPFWRGIPHHWAAFLGSYRLRHAHAPVDPKQLYGSGIQYLTWPSERKTLEANVDPTETDKATSITNRESSLDDLAIPLDKRFEATTD